MAADARAVAFSLLLQQQKSDSYTNLLLENSPGMRGFDTRDRAFIVSLVYGVVERRLTLDYNLSLYLKKPLKKLQPEVLCLLRMGAYQLFFCDKVPASAAVNESVRLARIKCGYAAGLVNAVLRKTAQNGLCFPADTASDDYLSVRYSCPKWLIEQWRTDYGEEDAAGILKSSLEPTGLTVRVNTTKTTLSSLRASLESQGIVCEPLDLPDALRLQKLPCSLSALPQFRDGLFHVQDKASMLCAMAVQPQPGQLVYDLCAAPGGKTFTMAQLMQNSGRIHSFDLYPRRVAMIETGAERLSLSCVRAMQGDAAVFNETLAKADRVLCDVPCSGLGILRQKPEVKYKPPQSLQGLPELQLSILCVGARYLKPDGRLVYSTCALDRRENEAVCESFLQSNPDFEPVAPLPQFSDRRFFTVMPHKMDCDGFFIAAFQRR